MWRFSFFILILSFSRSLSLTRLTYRLANFLHFRPQNFLFFIQKLCAMQKDYSPIFRCAPSLSDDEDKILLSFVVSFGFIYFCFFTSFACRELNSHPTVDLSTTKAFLPSLFMSLSFLAVRSESLRLGIIRASSCNWTAIKCSISNDEKLQSHEKRHNKFRDNFLSVACECKCRKITPHHILSFIMCT